MPTSNSVSELVASDMEELLQGWPDKIPFMERPDLRWLDYVLSQDQVFVLCLRPHQDPQRIAAYAQFDIEDGNAWIAIATHPRYQRRGLGRELLQASIARLPGWGARQIVAAIAHANQASLIFFQRMGFTRLAEDCPICVEPDLVYLTRSLMADPEGGD